VIDVSTDYDELLALLPKFPSAQLIVVCSACAEIVAPIAHTLGDDRTREVANSVRQLPWTGSKVENPTEFVDRLYALPDANIDDSHSPLYYVARSLHVMGEKLRVIESEDPLSVAISACNGTLDIASDFDYICKLGQAARTPDRLQAKAERDLRRIVETIQQEMTADKIASIAEIASGLANDFASELPTIDQVLSATCRVRPDSDEARSAASATAASHIPSTEKRETQG
jgi:hypothetical protein